MTTQLLSNICLWYRADVLRENTEAVFAACDAAHGRWAKLLGVRAALHPKLRLQEFLIIYNVTEEFVAATEKVISFPVWKICTNVHYAHHCIHASYDFIVSSYSCRLEAGWVTTSVELYNNNQSNLLTISILSGWVIKFVDYQHLLNSTMVNNLHEFTDDEKLKGHSSNVIYKERIILNIRLQSIIVHKLQWIIVLFWKNINHSTLSLTPQL